MWGRTSSAPRSLDSRERLGERRRRLRRRLRLAALILAFTVMGAALYGVNRPGVRIQTISVEGTPIDLVSYAEVAMHGSYAAVIPRDSIFFYPEGAIRRAILREHPEFAAVSIKRVSPTALVIVATERTAVSRWCGFAPHIDSDDQCYLFDPNGFLFATAATTSAPVNPFLVYAPLLGDAKAPLRSTLMAADVLPAIFDLARHIGQMSVRVEKIVLRDTEVDLYLSTATSEQGTRITYVLGAEQQAFTALVSAGPDLSLAQGDLEYIDLRFAGKVYIKKRSE